MSGTVVVIGGGISGLAAAHRLVERSVPVTLLEGSPRLGGQIRTERDGEFVFETGADTLLTQKPWGIALCERLGLSAEIDDLGARQTGTAILLGGRLIPVPPGFVMMAPTRYRPVLASPLFSWAGKLRLLAEPLVPRRHASQEDESLAGFVSRRFGREVLERVAEPVVAGLYTADAARLSLRLTMPRFLDLEAKEGSVTRGLRKAMRARGTRPFGHGTGGGAFVALRSGMERIVTALAERMPEGSVRTGVRVSGVAKVEGSGFRVQCESGERFEADAVIMACPAYEAARLLRGLDPEAAAGLESLVYASCATVHLVYGKADLRIPDAYFGFFVPRTEGSGILACSFVSEKFHDRAPAGTAVLRVFVGGALRPGILQDHDAAIAARAHDALRDVLDIKVPPRASRVHRHPMAMPQYDAGAGPALARAVEQAERHDGLFITGGIAGAIGIPDCVRVAEAAADRVALRQGAGRVAYQANQKA